MPLHCSCKSGTTSSVSSSKKRFDLRGNADTADPSITLEAHCEEASLGARIHIQALRAAAGRLSNPRFAGAKVGI
ncbi:hypothetical protein DENIT_80018 [Pseudomonas veronii]|nr:hypothetical protein DENIT_80018 [Pseudomonas veronii]